MHGQDASASRALPHWLAIVLVVGTSAAVLVLEILAGRLLAPYVGVSLETYTGIIGTVLAGIALGAWAGGVLADRVDPRGLLPVLLVLGGALAIATVPVVRTIGDLGGESRGLRILVLSAIGFIPSATVLSAVPPAVVKLQLRDLATTGTTVGRLSAYGTAGAIAGTFLTGFVLVATAAVTTLIVGVGVALIVSGVALWAATTGRARRDSASQMASAGGLGVLALLGVAVVDTPCQVQTAYYCASIEPDPFNATGRTLVLDDLNHSYVDLADPTRLEFWYIRRITDAIDATAEPGPVDAVYVGGGGFTLPSWARTTRPGSNQTVLEIDGELVDLVDDELGFEPGPDVTVVVDDARLSLGRLDDDSADVVVGDAFGGRAVPWHLATGEFVEEVARVLRPDGLYAINVIDGPDQRFLRAEAATLAEVFDHVTVVLGPGADRGARGNSVILASDQPFDVEALERARTDVGDGGRIVDDLAAFVDDARVLTDDFAPVDQLIAGGI